MDMQRLAAEYDYRTEMAHLFVLFLDDLERDYRDEEKDLCVSVDTLLTLARRRVAALEARRRCAL